MKHAPIEIHPLSNERLEDFLAFFDGEAFADNPKWGFCYCQFAYVDHSKIEWKTRKAEQNRQAACQRIQAGTMQGLLAYRDGKPIGWCNAAPRTMLDSFADEPDPDAALIGQITCFVVAREHRHSGVAKALLEAACDGLRSKNLTIAEASANPNASTDAENHDGPLGMYLAAGFTVHKTEDDGYVTVRRHLEYLPRTSFVSPKRPADDVGRGCGCGQLLVDELPRIRSIESANAHRRDELGFEVPKVHPVLRAGRRLQRLPMRDAPTSLAVNGAQSLVTPDVRRGGVGVPLDPDRAELEVDPRSANAAAQRAVAIGRGHGCRRQGHSNRAAVA
jgi:GNAT superfamily N-acetyltransferase